MTGRPFACRSCGQGNVQTILDMGSTPLANALLTADQLGKPEPSFPLRLVFCPACSLVQIDETVPPEQLFAHYLYLSSFSETMLRHAKQIATRLAADRKLGSGSRVIEIASNDGYLLQYYKEMDIPVLGIEPAKNIAEIATRQRGVPTLCDFFTRDLALRLQKENTRADVIHANNVMAHVADLNGFVAGIAALLKPEGQAVIEAPYLGDMIQHIEFDTIYHEHLCYFSLTALDKLFSRHGLIIVDVELLPIHGGSLRIIAQREESDTECSKQVFDLLAAEKKLGMDRPAYYQDFARRVDQLKIDLRKLLMELKASGKSIAVYGASAKGSTLLNYFQLAAPVLDFVVDRSTLKQGRYTPGTHLPILAPEALLGKKPDYVLLLTWNFKDEILAQQAEYRRRGGKFIIPLPRPQVV